MPHWIRTTALLGLGLLATAAGAEDLLDVYRAALQADATLAISRARYDEARAGRPLARADLLPQLSASAGLSYHEQNYDDVPPEKAALYKDDHFRRRSWGLRLDQSLFDRQRWLRLEEADSQLAQASAELEAAGQQLGLRVAEAYFDVLAARDTLRFARAERKALGDQLAQIRQRFELGAAAITDVHDTRARYDLAVAQEIDAYNQYHIEKEKLRVIMGRIPGRLDGLGEELTLSPPDPPNADAWVERALADNPALRAARAAVVTARREVKRQRAGHLPTLDLTAEHHLQDDDGGFSQGKAQETTVSLSLRLPIYSGGKVSARVAQADARQRQAEKNRLLQEREVARQTRAAFRNVMSGISRVRALAQALRSTRTALDAARTGYEVGTRTAVDVLLALRETYRARRDYARARYDYLLATLRLEQAAGRLDEGVLARLNALLVPARPDDEAAGPTPPPCRDAATETPATGRPQPRCAG